MTQVLVLIVLSVVAAGILLLIVPGMRPASGAAHHVSTLRRYRSPEAAGGVAAVIVAALAAAQFAVVLDRPDQVGVLLGVVLAVMSSVAALRGALNLLVGALGIAASLAAAGEFLTADPLCSNDSGVSRWLTLGTLMLTFTVGAVVALTMLRVRPRPHTGLALFGVIDVLTFLAAPLGVSALPFTGGLLVRVTVAAGLGVAAVYAPRLVIGLAAVAITTVVIGATAVVGAGAGCAASGGAAQLTLVICCLTPYLIIRGAIGVLSSRGRNDGHS